MASKDIAIDIDSVESFSEELVSFMMERPSLAGVSSWSLVPGPPVPLCVGRSV